MSVKYQSSELIVRPIGVTIVDAFLACLIAVFSADNGNYYKNPASKVVFGSRGVSALGWIP
jgi:hypothetical protein